MFAYSNNMSGNLMSRLSVISFWVLFTALIETEPNRTFETGFRKCTKMLRNDSPWRAKREGYH